MKLLSKITFNGNNDLVVWKHPNSYFTENAELVVPFTHEAILIKDGQALGSYKPGKHLINDKQNFKISFFNKEKPEMCEIYYINKSLNLPIKWGTHTQMDLFDPMLSIPVRIGAHGEFEIKISNPRKFLLKVVGNTDGMTKEMIQDLFRDKMGMYIKNAIAEAMVTGRISFYEMSSKLKVISNTIKQDLSGEFENYGTSLESFLIASVVIPEDIKHTLEKAFLEKAKEKINEDYFSKKVETEKVFVSEKPKQTIECSVCGAKLPIESNFCSACGNQLYIEEVIEEKESKKISEREVYVET